MDFLFDTIASVLAFFYDLTSSYGGAIVLLTLAVMVVVTPLTLKSTRSMIAMQRLQPELRRLQTKYKDDRQKLNEEMMAFYREHNINPLGGCLPLLVQMPVFLVLYQVLNGLAWHAPYGLHMGRSAGLAVRHPEGLGRYEMFGTFDPKYLDHSTALYRDLSVSRDMRTFGIDLADWFTNRLSDGVVAALPYLILVVLVGVTAWYQQRQIMARNANNQSQINPQQQMLMKVLPFFLPVISLTLPAGLVLYFLVSNLYRIGQQAFITRTMYADQKGGSGKGAKGKGGQDKAPSRADTAPTGTRGLLGGLIQLPGRPSDGEDDSSSDTGSSTAEGGERAGKASRTGSGSGGAGTKAPTRQAPPPPAPSSQNRSKKKRKRK